VSPDTGPRGLRENASHSANELGTGSGSSTLCRFFFFFFLGALSGESIMVC
jgi:hypothetical protein